MPMPAAVASTAKGRNTRDNAGTSDAAAMPRTNESGEKRMMILQVDGEA
jgi:hypothetical protein